jgi:DNA polymerase-3 subunit gamma/tau
MCAKVLVPSSDQTEVGSLARIERLERRIGMGGTATAVSEQPRETPAPAKSAPLAEVPPKEAPKADKTADVSAPAGIGGVTLTQFKDSWPNILTIVNKKSKAAWMVAFALSVVDFTGDVLTLKFLSQKDLDSFKNSNGASEVLRGAIMDVLGVQVKFKAQIDAAKDEPATAPVAAPVKVETTPIAVVKEVAPEVEAPAAEDSAPVQETATEKPAETKSRNSGMADESARYGESLLREMLGAEPMQDKNGK